MEMYSREEISEQKDLRSRAKAAAFAVCAVAAAICAVLLICVRPLNEGLFRVIASAAAVLAGCVVIYVSSFVLPYMRPKPKKRGFGGKVLHVLGNIVRQLHMYIIWGLIAAIFVSFLFNLATDTKPEKKVTIWVDADSVKSAELQTVLDEDLPEGIKMTKVHSFSYSVFGMAQPGADDIYIVKAENAEQFLEGFAPLEQFLGGTEGAEALRSALRESVSVKDTGDAQLKPLGDYYGKDGALLGIMVFYSPLYTSGAASEYIDYSAEEGSGMAYYIFFGKDSLHPGKDGAAAYIAQRLLQLP